MCVYYCHNYIFYYYCIAKVNGTRDHGRFCSFIKCLFWHSFRLKTVVWSTGRWHFTVRVMIICIWHLILMTNTLKSHNQMIILWLLYTHSCTQGTIKIYLQRDISFQLYISYLTSANCLCRTQHDSVVQCWHSNFFWVLFLFMFYILQFNDYSL